MRVRMIFCFAISLLLLPTRVRPLSVISSSHTTRRTDVATIAVCTGADCRVDGASDCLRGIQQHKLIQKARSKATPGSKGIKVVARPCLGPCGDGPCVTVLDEGQKKVVEPRAKKGPVSLAPPDMFGVNPKGIYQVRTRQDIDFVVQLAAKTADLTDLLEEERISSPEQEVEDVPVVTSSRVWYDRPRNERKALQRFMQFLVLVGLYNYSNSEGSIGTLQWQVAASLLVASIFIMRENLLETLWKQLRRKR